MIIMTIALYKRPMVVPCVELIVLINKQSDLFWKKITGSFARCLLFVSLFDDFTNNVKPIVTVMVKCLAFM